MSKELIEKLRAAAEYRNNPVGDLFKEAADALEAKAAPVGELEAFEAAMGSALIAEQGEFALSRAYEEGRPYTFLATKWAWAAWQAAYQRAQQPQSAEAVGEVQLKTGGGISLLHVDLSQPLPPGTKLYTTPQPSAGVVMPERITLCGTPDIAKWERGWNACLDEFARLNGKEVGRG